MGLHGVIADVPSTWKLLDCPCHLALPSDLDCSLSIIYLAGLELLAFF